MKVVLKIICLLFAAYAVYFPFSYFHQNADKKEAKISHILVSTEEDALKIKQEIDKGKSFESAAVEYSECPSKEQRGDLGYNIKGGKLFPEFEEVAFKLPLRTVSDPVKTPDGWHLIKVYDYVYFSDRKNFDERYVYL